MTCDVGHVTLASERMKEDRKVGHDLITINAVTMYVHYMLQAPLDVPHLPDSGFLIDLQPSRVANQN